MAICTTPSMLIVTHCTVLIKSFPEKIRSDVFLFHGGSHTQKGICAHLGYFLVFFFSVTTRHQYTMLSSAPSFLGSHAAFGRVHFIPFFATLFLLGLWCTLCRPKIEIHARNIYF